MNLNTLCASIALLFAAASSLLALLPDSEARVSVHVPEGINEKIVHDFNAETPYYLFIYNTGKSSMTTLRAKSGSEMSENVIAPNSKSLACSIAAGNEIYTTANDTSAKSVWFRKSGKYLWEISITNIEFINDSGKKLPALADQWFWFWNDKVYTSIVIRTDSFIPAISAIYMDVIYTDVAFTSIKDEKTDISIDDSFTAIQASGDYAIFSNQKNKVTMTQSSVNFKDMDNWEILRDSSRNSITSRIYLYDSKVHRGRTIDLPANEEKRIPIAFHIINSNSVNDAINEVMCDKNPLAGDEFAVTESTYAGSQAMGFDAERGCYTLQIQQKPESIWWDDDKNFILETAVRIKNSNRNRPFRLRTYETPYTYNVTGTSSVLCDKDKFPIGVPVQISKKWDGNIHPNYTETYCILNLRRNEEFELWHRTAYHNWGNNVMVGIPSLDLIDYNGLYGIWLESHIGASETICYSHDDVRGGLIQDFRAQLGTKGQMNTKHDSCWYDNSGGANLFRLLRPDAEDVYLKRLGNGINWYSVGPKLASLHWKERTLSKYPDIETEAESYLLPSKKNSRAFYKYRTEFKESFDVADPHTELCLFVMGDRRYYSVQVPSTLWHTGENGNIIKSAVAYDKNGWALKGVKLGGDKPWIAAGDSIVHPQSPEAYPGDSNHVGVVIHNISGTIGGEKISKDTLSYSTLQNIAIGKCEISITPDIPIKKVNKGDYVEMLVEYFTWDFRDGATSPIEAEAAFNMPEVKSIRGKVVNSFPVKVAADDNTAEFELSGGVGFNVVQASNFKSYKPVFEVYRNGRYNPIEFSYHINDGWQTDYDPVSKRYTFTIAVPPNEKDPKSPVRYRVSSQ